MFVLLLIPRFIHVYTTAQINILSNCFKEEVSNDASISENENEDIQDVDDDEFDGSNYGEYEYPDDEDAESDFPNQFDDYNPEELYEVMFDFTKNQL